MDASSQAMLPPEKEIATGTQDTTAAAALVKVGDLPKLADLPKSELAAWTAVGNVLLNLKEMITN